MPEDLRSKEMEERSKQKSDKDKGFDLDLVIPESDKLKKTNSGESFSTKLKRVFSRPPRFGKSSAKKARPKEKKPAPSPTMPSHREGPKIKVHDDFHLPAHSIRRSSLKIDYNKAPGSSADSYVKPQDKKPHQIKESLTDKTIDTESAGAKLSFWDKIKNLFAKKNHGPKIEKVPAKPITPVAEIKPEQEQKPLEKKEFIKIEEPEIDLSPKQPEQEEKPPVTAEPKLEEEATQAGSGFVIPELKDEVQKPDKTADNQPDKDKKSEPETEEKPAKFHQPQPRIRAKFLDDGGGVDLIPIAARTRSWRQLTNLLFIAIFVSLLIIGGFYGFLYYQGYNITKQRDNRVEQISDLERQIVTYEDLNKEIQALGDDIRLVDNLLNFHFYWSNFFAMLEKYTIAEVHYSGLSAGNGGSLSLHAIATDYQAVARQIKVLEQPEAKEDFVTSIDVNSARQNSPDEVTFDITMILNPSLFYYGEPANSDE